VPQVLELTQLIEHNKVPESKVGTSWINTQLDAQWFVTMQAVFKFALTDYSFGVDADGVG
jgi:hypothetical protein